MLHDVLGNLKAMNLISKDPDGDSSSAQRNTPDLANQLRKMNMHGEELVNLLDPDDEDLQNWSCKLFVKIFNSSFIQFKQVAEALSKIWKLVQNLEIKQNWERSDHVHGNFIVENTPWLVKVACMAIKMVASFLILSSLPFLTTDYPSKVYLEPVSWRQSWL